MARTTTTHAENVSQRINLDVAHYIKEHPQSQIDELLLIAAAPAVHADFSNLQLKDMRVVMIRMKGFVKHRPRFKNYTKEATIEGLKQEWLPTIEDDDKMTLLDDIKVVGKNAVDENGIVTPNEEWYNTFVSINPDDKTQYGNQDYKKQGTSKVPKINVKTIKPDLSLEEKLKPYIKWYKKNFESNILNLEKYKWEATKAFKDVIPDVNSLYADDVTNKLEKPFRIADNLLTSSHYYAGSVFLKAMRIAKEDTRSALAMLFNEEQPLGERADNFITQMKTIVEVNRGTDKFGPKDTCQQDMHAVSVYLSLMYPDRHFIYKSSVWKNFVDLVGLDYPSLSSYTHKLEGFDGLCEHIREVLMKDNELLRIHDKAFKDDISNYHLLTQDFIYAIAVYLVNKGESVN